MFHGFLSLGGVELINAEATESYVANLAPRLGLRGVYNSTTTHVANEVGEYRSPLLDGAPWVNPLDPSTHHFYGLYPISVEGLDDITLGASITEYLGDGGATGLQRETSKSIRVSGLLVGANALAVHAGLSWLGGALRDSTCQDCTAGELRYFIADPDVCEYAYGPVSGQRRRSFGATGTGVLRYSWQPGDQVPEQMPANVRWVGIWDEGSVFSWGAVSDTGEILLDRSPVAPLRRNYIQNPTFATGLSTWNVGSNTSWVAAGGVDDGGYLAVPTPAGSLAPYGSGAYGAGLYSRAVQPVSTSTTEALKGQVTMSLALRSGSGNPITVQLSTPSGPIATLNVTPGASWTRYTLSGTAASAAIVTLTTYSAGAYDLDQVCLERGSMDLGYFDGTSVAPDYARSWEGAPHASIARSVWTGTASIERDDSDFRPVITILTGAAQALELNWDDRPRIDMDTQLLPYERRMYEVACTEGVKVIQQKDLGGAGAYMQVEFVLTAGKPQPYMLPVPVSTAPITSGIFADPVATSTYEDLSWLSDPNAVVVTRPPASPVIINPAIETITVWTRSYIPIPATAVGDWTAVVPTIGITSKADAITQVRVRFHANPFNYAPTAVDPLSYCGEFIVSYLPAVTRLELDGVLQTSTATRANRAPANADHLLYGADGTPITWPELSCGIAYVMTIDIPPTAVADSFTVDLALRKRT